MSVDEYPDWLLDALDRVPPRPEAQAGEDGEGAPIAGGVYSVQHMDVLAVDRRLVLVLGTRLDLGVVDVALVSNETEMATDCDVVMPGTAVGTGYDVMFQSDLLAPMFSYQLDRRVGQVESQLVDLIVRAQESECVEISAGQRGLPITRDDDPRWQFKREELKAVQALAADCVQWIVEGGPEREKYVDPALLLDATSEEWEKATSSILLLSDLMDEGWKLPAVVLGAFSESGVSLLSGDPDQAMALMQIQVRSEPEGKAADIDMRLDSGSSRTEAEVLALERLSEHLASRGVPCGRMRGGSQLPDKPRSWSIGRDRQSRISVHLLSIAS